MRRRPNEVRTEKSLVFLTQFDVFCDPLQNRRTATWNLFVLPNKEAKVVYGVVIYASFCP